MILLADVVYDIVSSEVFKVILLMVVVMVLIVAGNYLNRYLLTQLLIWQKKRLNEKEISSIHYSSTPIIMGLIQTIFESFFINERKRKNKNFQEEKNIKSNYDTSKESSHIELNSPEEKENKLGEESPIKDFYYFINMELSKASQTRSVYINMYMAFTIAIIFFFFVFNEMEFPVRVTLSGAYISYSLFSVYIIKTSYRRVSLMLSLLEDSERKNDITDFFTKYKKGKDLNSYDIEFLKMLTISRAEREKSVNHPYEVIFNNLNDSDVEINKKGIKLSRNKNKK